jgi:hypothetical protein
MLPPDEPSLPTDDVQPISLYLDLVPGAIADLEVVAQASLHFVAALREAAQILSPNLELRVELRSGSEGSLSLNSIIKAINPSGKVDRKTIQTIALASAAWFGVHVADWTFDKVADSLWNAATPTEAHAQAPKSETVRLSDDDIASISAQLNQLQHAPSVQEHVGKVYRELTKDSAISGVGISLSQKPEHPGTIVRREEFSGRILDAKEAQEAKKVRTTSEVEIVKLVSPILDPDSRRRWIIEGAEGNVAASMDDPRFKARLREGLITTPLRENIRLRVNITKTEQMVAGEWKVTKRSITQVERIILPNAEEDLTAGSGE